MVCLYFSVGNKALTFGQLVSFILKQKTLPCRQRPCLASYVVLHGMITVFVEWCRISISALNLRHVPNYQIAFYLA